MAVCSFREAATSRRQFAPATGKVKPVLFGRALHLRRDPLGFFGFCEVGFSVAVHRGTDVAVPIR
jgi:hypothetical protein